VADGGNRSQPTGRGAVRTAKVRPRAVIVGLAATAVAAVMILVACTGGGGDGTDDSAGTGGAAAPSIPGATAPSIPGTTAPPIPEGVRTFEGLSQDHVSGPVAYAQTPPVGGEHDPIWQNCGSYTEPIVTERGVHSLEHGAVWITHRPDLAPDQIEILRRLAASQSHILVSPWAGELPSPVMASAWGRQLTLASATDPGLDAFVRAFRMGPQTPEPGARCTGGRSMAG
jgi:hypothetical protein